MLTGQKLCTLEVITLILGSTLSAVVYPCLLGVLMSWEIVVGRVGGAADRPLARGKFSKTGSKTGPPGAFCTNCDVWRWTLDLSFMYCIKI